jgi:hypothetical protein
MGYPASQVSGGGGANTKAGGPLTESTYQYSAVAAGRTRGAGTVTTGTQFSLTGPQSCLGVRCDWIGANASATVYLWNNAGTLLASKAFTGTEGSNIVLFDTPQALVAAASYTVGLYSAGIYMAYTNLNVTGTKLTPPGYAGGGVHAIAWNLFSTSAATKPTSAAGSELYGVEPYFGV